MPKIETNQENITQYNTNYSFRLKCLVALSDAAVITAGVIAASMAAYAALTTAAVITSQALTATALIASITIASSILTVVSSVIGVALLSAAIFLLPYLFCLHTGPRLPCLITPMYGPTLYPLNNGGIYPSRHQYVDQSNGFSNGFFSHGGTNHGHPSLPYGGGNANHAHPSTFHGTAGQHIGGHSHSVHGH